MWLATRYGFYSVVCGSQQEGADQGHVDSSVRMIRARCESHLASLKTNFADLLGDAKIFAKAGTDYAYRMIVPAETFAALMQRLVADLDYGNFKNAAHAQNPADKRYNQFLHEVWHVGVDRLQNKPGRG